jgi:Holliday junction resolvase RusA-like endonuclease
VDQLSRFTDICNRLQSAGLPLFTGELGKMVQLIIQGEPASKANQRKLVRFGKRPGFIKSAKARSFAASAAMQLRAQYKAAPMTGRVSVVITIAYESMRPDLDEALVLDAMQGIVFENDRQVVLKLVKRAAADKGFVTIMVAEYDDKD